MEFVKQLQIPGDIDAYKISEGIKKYTLIDLGFEESRRGNFLYSGSLDSNNPFKPMARLKITINPELSGFKMETVNTNGFAKVNIFKHPQHERLERQYHYILDEMVNRHVFDKVSGKSSN